MLIVLIVLIVLMVSVGDALSVTLGMYEPPPPCVLYVRDKAFPWLAGNSMLLDKALIILAYTRSCTHTHIHTRFVCLQTLIKLCRFN